MKSAATLSFKTLTSKIHPPLTLNPRESQQLLSLLTSTFRRQLDHEHSSFQKNIGDEAGGKRRVRREDASARRSRSYEGHQTPFSLLTSSTLADSHFQSVLTNPLLSLAPRKRRASSPNRSILSTSSGSNGFDSAQRIFSNPMAWFDEQFALGLATVDMAAFCLETHQQSLRSCPDISITRGMRDSGAGSKVLRWMTSSGLTKSNGHLSYESLLTLTVPYLVAEERQPVIWEWLDRDFLVPSGIRYQRQGNERQPEVSLAKGRRKLLLLLIKAEYYQGGGIDTAMAHFLRFVQKSKAVDDGEVITTSRDNHGPSTSQKISSPAGQFLTSVLALTSRMGTPDTELFDKLCSSVKNWAAEPMLSLARLQAFHPTTPDPAPSLRYFRSLPLESLPVSIKKRKYTVVLLLETARLLLEKGNFHDGNWLMKYTGAGFAQDLGLHITETKSTASADGPDKPSKEEELANLLLLEGLELRYS